MVSSLKYLILFALVIIQVISSWADNLIGILVW